MSMPIIKSLTIKAANIPLNRPVVAKVGRFDNWAVIITEITCNDGTVGKGYIGPYLADYMPAIASTIKQLFICDMSNETLQKPIILTPDKALRVNALQTNELGLDMLYDIIG